MEAEGGGDLAIGQRQHLGQLGDEYPLGPLVVAGVAGDQVSVQEDAALIVDRNDFQSRGERADGQRRWAGHAQKRNRIGGS